MTKPTIKLDLLEQIILAPDDRAVAEASLSAYQEVVSGDFFSVVYFNLESLMADVFLEGPGWLTAIHPTLRGIREKLTDHPLTQKFLRDKRSDALLRSQEVPNAVWRGTTIYNEVDRPLGIQDVATVYQITTNNNVIALTCGRDRCFSERDFATVRSFHRFLNGMKPFQLPALPSGASPAAATYDRRPLERLTSREREVLHWVREGKKNSEIAALLGISEHTVHHHLEKVFSKLCVTTRTAAANFRGV